MLAGKPMLAHVIERLRPQVGALVINANGDPARFAAFGLPVVADTVDGFVGPLAGVLAGMRWSAAQRARRALDRHRLHRCAVPAARSGGAAARRPSKAAATPSRSPNRAANCTP